MISDFLQEKGRGCSKCIKLALLDSSVFNRINKYVINVFCSGTTGILDYVHIGDSIVGRIWEYLDTRRRGA